MDPGIADLYNSVGLDGLPPRGLNKLSDAIRKKQYIILGRSWALTIHYFWNVIDIDSVVMGSKKANVKNIFRKGNKKDPREAQSSQFYLSGPERFWKLFAGT